MGTEKPAAPKLKREFQIEEVVVDPGKVSDEVLASALKTERLYALLGLALGTVIIVAGLVFAIFGFSESIDITVEGGGAKGHIVTGSLGLVLVLVGVLLIYFTRYRVKLTSPPSETR